MDPSRSAQDVVRCDLCRKAIVQMFCDLCHVNLCRPCIGEHISDDHNKHQIVPFHQRKSTLIYPICTKHQTKRSKFQCEECNTSVCSLCTISDTHKGHNITPLLDFFISKREVIAKDIEELENIYFPTYEEIASDIETQIANLDGEYDKLSTEVTKHGEEWHGEIENIIKKMKIEIEKTKIKHMSILKKHLDEIVKMQNLIEQTQLNLSEIEESNKVLMTMRYRSRNSDFSKIPPKVEIALPKFSLKEIDTDILYNLFGSLTLLSVRSEEHVYTLKKPKTPTKVLLKEPELIATINTGFKKLRSVTCLSEEEIWTSAEVSNMKCLNIQSFLIRTIRTKSGKWPHDIAMTSDGGLLYSDWETKTVNKVKNGQIKEVIRLQGWVPVNICVTFTGDLLVTMYREDKIKSKVVRYSGSTVKQTIQFDEEGKPLYSGNDYIKFITENRNQDICVADSIAFVVVVVNQAGKLRFRYTGHFSVTKNKPFIPNGIATDSQGQILTADASNCCIHILDQHGQFLHNIDNCYLNCPFGLYVYKEDNLFVAEWNGTLKKIKYLG